MNERERESRAALREVQLLLSGANARRLTENQRAALRLCMSLLEARVHDAEAEGD